jgi:putative membrane-bound dehydrogenase-like protein
MYSSTPVFLGRLAVATGVGIALRISVAIAVAEPPPVPGPRVTSLFDGKTLAGWEGSEKLWRVQDGALTGGSLSETIKDNDFLASTTDHANFIIRFKIKLTGSEGFINSGFQIRSQRVPDNSEMIGYQCDYGEPSWYGGIYDESRRNKLMAASDMTALRPVIKQDDWNEYVIRADGPRVTTWINGVLGVDYVEADPNIEQTGKFGIQVHGGGKALVQVKEVTLEELPASPKREGAAEPSKPAGESPLPAAQEKAAFSLAPGLEMELVVEEDIDKGFGKFVAVHFDPRGRLWTMTALEYPVDANENQAAADALYASKAKDTVLVYDVVDRGTDGEGPRYAKEPTVFADGLAIPLGILPYKDGCYVQHGPDIVFLRDIDGDGRADQREVVLAGFGVQDSHLFPHQFTRAPGGWLWLAQGAFNYSNVTGPNLPEPVKFDQTRMAKFRPDGSQFTITSNGPCNIWGLVMNGEGETFIQEANDFGYPVMPFHEYANYPGCSNGQWKSYAPEFPSIAPEFRMGGTGLSGLALTDASGAFPPEWSDVMLVANPITNRIQAIKMHRSAATGTGWILEKLPDVVVSGDPWFRPVAMTLGPDGAVYIVDWYNQIISHNEVPRNHPERDKKRGRIWRLKGKSEPGFPVPDFTRLSEGELVAKLGGPSVAQSHLAWQTLGDKETLQPETTQALTRLVAGHGHAARDGAGPYPDAARIQAVWVLLETRGLHSEDLQSLIESKSPQVRREAVGRSFVAAMGAAPDADARVRFAAITSLGQALGELSGERAATAVVEKLLAYANEPLPGPTAPSTQSGKPIKVGAAYEREYERYLVRMFLENVPEAVVAFLDSDAASKLPVENRMVACLALPAKESAPRVARLLPHLNRAPNDEEILRLAEAAEDADVRAALAALAGTPAGLDALLRQKTKFDAAGLQPLLAGTAEKLLTENRETALRVISAFKLTVLEEKVAGLLTAATTEPLPLLATLCDLGSTRSAVFLGYAKHADPAVRDVALAGLTTTPDVLLPLWPGLNAAQRQRALDALAASPAGATALIAAIRADTVPKDELDGPLVDKLQAVLKDDAGLKSLLDSMAGLFSEVLALNGEGAAFVDSKLTLSGPFTLETWIKLDPGIGNADSLLGAPGVLDVNFFDSRLRVWVGGLNDVIVAKKAMAPDVWTHVAVTRDADGRFKLYLNGELDQADGRPDPREYAGLAIGRSNVPEGTAAQLAEFRIWQTCRSADEIRAAFDRTGLDPAPAYYRPLNVAWDALHGPARVVKTMDFPPLVTPEAAKALDARFAHFRGLAEKPGGDPSRGKLAAAVCIACHKVGTEGGEIGPSLSAVGAMGTEAILRNILTPNAAMEPGYRVFRAELTDGSLKEGFLARQDAEAVVIRLPGIDDERIPTEKLRKAGFVRRSLMPEGLEAAFTPEQWTDLFAYLKTLR